MGDKKRLYTEQPDETRLLEYPCFDAACRVRADACQIVKSELNFNLARFFVTLIRDVTKIESL